jgi:hypothetical protein
MKMQVRDWLCAEISLSNVRAILVVLDLSTPHRFGVSRFWAVRLIIRFLRPVLVSCIGRHSCSYPPHRSSLDLLRSEVQPSLANSVRFSTLAPLLLDTRKVRVELLPPRSILNVEDLLFSFE